MKKIEMVSLFTMLSIPTMTVDPIIQTIVKVLAYI